MDKETFKQLILKDKSNEKLIPLKEFDDSIVDYAEVDDPDTRKDAIYNIQERVVEWFKELAGCNWSVGFIDDSEQSVLVVKWWFSGPTVEL